MYIKEIDVLLKLPSFNYSSFSKRKILGTVKGLIVLYTILNINPEVHYRAVEKEGNYKLQCLKKCGWTQALEESKGEYSCELVIDKPGMFPDKSPSPPANETTSDDEDMLEQLWAISESESRKRLLESESQPSKRWKEQ